MPSTGVLDSGLRVPGVAAAGGVPEGVWPGVFMMPCARHWRRALAAVKGRWTICRTVRLKRLPGDGEGEGGCTPT